MYHQHIRRTGFLIIYLALTIVSAKAAEFIVGNNTRFIKGYDVLIQGDIIPGDAERLIAVIKLYPNLYRIDLDSPGGSIIEALRMAEVISVTFLETKVGPGKICASACFFLYIAGVDRFAAPAEMMSESAQRRYREMTKRLGGGERSPEGFVGLHRPYFKEATGLDGRQAELMRKVSIHLESQLIPKRLIDLMMSRPSNDIYWLTEADLMELGSYGPDQEEFFIQKCGYVKNATKKALELIDQGRRSEGRAIFDKSEATQKCVSSLMDAFREKGRKKIYSGWKPRLNPL